MYASVYKVITNIQSRQYDEAYLVMEAKCGLDQILRLSLFAHSEYRDDLMLM